MRYPVGIGGRQQIGQGMIPEIEACPIDRRIDHRQTFDALLLEVARQARHRGDLPPAEWTVEPAKQADQNRLLSSEVIDRYLALTRDRIENDVRRAVTGLQRSLALIFGHGTLLHLRV